MALPKNSLRNLEKALHALGLACATPVTEARDLAGIVKSFEFVFELSWKSIQAFAAFNGQEVNSPRSAFKVAFQLQYVADPQIWIDILEDRNRTVHTYDENFAREMCLRIQDRYLPEFEKLFENLKLAESEF